MVRKARNLLPERKRFVISMINRCGQSIRVEPPLLGKQCPRMMDRLFLEIIAEREIAEHLEECVMPCCVADIVEIIVFATSPYAFLA